MQRTMTTILAATCGLAAGAQQMTHELFGPTPGDELGADVVPLGDINGDGLGDFAVGLPAADGLVANSGAVWAYSGADDTVPLEVRGQPVRSAPRSLVGLYRRQEW